MKLLISIILASLLFTSTSYASEYSEGLDVSSYQGTIDYSELPSEYKAVYIRAGEGNEFVDPKLEENYKNAKSQGLEYGFYYYVTAATVSEAEAQAQIFTNLIKGTDYTLRPAMDFEEFSDLSKEEINQIGIAFLTKLEELCGVTPVVYSYIVRSTYRRRW